MAVAPPSITAPPITPFWRRHVSEISGAGSGAATRLISQPFDVVKIRFQLQLEPIAHDRASKYRSVWQAFRSIVGEEGLFALWKGHLPAQTLSIAYGLIQFAVYEKLRALYRSPQHADQPISSSVALNLVCGALAGAIGVGVTLPMDVMRTRLIAESGTVHLRSISQVAKWTYRTNGVGGFWSGALPAVMQIVPHNAMAFATYGFLRHHNFTVASSEKETSATRSVRSLLAGFFAGILAKTVVFPLDVAKKRLQIQGLEKRRQKAGFGRQAQFSGLFDCIVQLARNEGVLRGLYKGYVPGALKAAIAVSASFFFYELFYSTLSGA